MPRAICVLVSIFALFLINCGGSKSNPSAAVQLPSPSPAATPIPSPSPSPTPAPASAFIYAIITEPDAPHGENAPNELRGWGLHAGQLEPVGNPAISLLPNIGPQNIAVSPRNKLLYVMCPDTIFTNRLYSFAINTDGSLSQAGDSFSMGRAVPMVFDPMGGFLFVGADDGLHEFRIDPDTDLLTEMPGSPFAAGSDRVTGGTAVHPSGRWVYASTNAGITGFAFDSATGTLTPLPGNPLAIGQGDVVNIVPSGNYLYVLQEIPTGALRTYSIDARGNLQLSFAGGVPYFGGLRHLSFDADSGTTYIPGSNLNVAQIQLAKIDPDNGTLNLQPLSLPIPEDIGSEHSIVSIVVRPSDRTVLVSSFCAVYLLRLQPDGTPQMPPLARADATDGLFFEIGAIAATH